MSTKNNIPFKMITEYLHFEKKEEKKDTYRRNKEAFMLQTKACLCSNV